MCPNAETIRQAFYEDGSVSLELIAHVSMCGACNPEGMAHTTIWRYDITQDGRRIAAIRSKWVINFINGDHADPITETIVLWTLGRAFAATLPRDIDMRISELEIEGRAIGRFTIGEAKREP